MSTSVRTFVDYLLDVETTSEVTFNEELPQHGKLFDTDHLPYFEQIIENKLLQWKDFDQRERSAATESVVRKPRVEGTSDDSDDESEDDQLTEAKSGARIEGFPEIQVVDQNDECLDAAGQCQRLLQLLYYCQQHHSHFNDLYFRTIDCCVKSGNEKIMIIALEQIVLHLTENKQDIEGQNRLQECLPSDTVSSITSPSQQELLNRIQALLSINEIEQETVPIFSSDNIAELYPYKARFIDVRQEFRDSTHYFIDGDSLLLSIAHHTNVDLESYYGNTLHVIYIIERILLRLSSQSNQCNYTLLFFDCHHRLYQKEMAILTLLRACLISHLSKNTKKCGIAKFSTWLDDEYTKFAKEEKPMFLFYHDMSGFDRDNDRLLSKEALENLLISYRLYGNYHQYYIQTHLYLMNKLNLTDLSVQCFQIRYTRKCSMKILAESFEFFSSQFMDRTNDKVYKNTDLEKSTHEISDGDVRVFLYLKTLAQLISNKQDQPEVQNQVKLFSSLLVLHMALLTRLSLIDRHVPLSFPSMTFGSLFSEILSQFQRELAMNLSLPCSSFSWTKVIDLYDGRLFAFTLHQIHQSSSNIRFDSTTINIIEQSLILLNIPFMENFFSNVLQQIIESNEIIFTPSRSEQSFASIEKPSQRQKITRISNRFIDQHLEPILSSEKQLGIEWIDPTKINAPKYKGKYHWHIYKEVGSEIERIRDNEEEDKKTRKPHKKTRNKQKLYTFYQAYSDSLTSGDVKDKKLQILLPPTIPANDRKKVETEKLAEIEALLERISLDEYSSSIDVIEKKFADFEIPEIRLQSLRKKLEFQRIHLSTLRKKSTVTSEEKSKLEFLRAIYPVTKSVVDELEKEQSKTTDVTTTDVERQREEKHVPEDTRKLTNIEILLKQISSDDYSSAIDLIEKNLPDFKSSTVRLKLLRRKFDFERNYLRTLRKKPMLTTDEKSKLQRLQVACLATISHMVKSEGIRCETDIFNQKKTLMEELIGHSPLGLENWYRFQMESVNSRLPRREQGQPDDRILCFSKETWNPDPWQVDFLNAIDQQESVIIVAPTASGKTYASYYAMYAVLKEKFGPKGVCVCCANEGISQSSCR